jgi:Predicted restriction endonuclease
MIEKEFNELCSFRRKHPPVKGETISTNSELVKPVFANLTALRNKLENRFKNYKGVDLKFEYSRGASNFPNILHVSILPPEQKVSNGIYIVICFDKLGRGALAGCAESKTHPKGLDVITRKKSNKDELTIDVDGATENTKYNNTFANPKEFYYELIDDKELFDHLEASLKLVLFKLNLIDSSNIPVKDLVTSTSFSTPFNPENVEDGRKKIAREISVRQGQPKFRKDLLKAYNYQCAISGCEIQPILEAAHIVPYKGKETNHIQNGILLRADLHTLFDLQLISVNPITKIVSIDVSLKDSEYSIYNGIKLNLPKDIASHPSEEALILRDKAKNTI